jgi:hypothetical protein
VVSQGPQNQQQPKMLLFLPFVLVDTPGLSHIDVSASYRVSEKVTGSLKTDWEFEISN